MSLAMFVLGLLAGAAGAGSEKPVPDLAGIDTPAKLVVAAPEPPPAEAA